MPRVYRQQYTRPIPEGAQRITVTVKKRGKEEKVPAVRFRGDDGKWVVALLTAKGDRCRVKSPNYSGKVAGKPVVLGPNKEAAEILLGDLRRKHARGEAGMLDPFEEHHKRPLLEHLADYRQHL